MKTFITCQENYKEQNVESRLEIWSYYDTSLLNGKIKQSNNCLIEGHKSSCIYFSTKNVAPFVTSIYVS